MGSSPISSDTSVAIWSTSNCFIIDNLTIENFCLHGKQLENACKFFRKFSIMVCNWNLGSAVVKCSTFSAEKTDLKLSTAKTAFYFKIINRLLYIALFLFLSVSLSALYLPVCLSVFLPVCLSCLPVCLLVFVCQPECLPACLSVCLFIWLFVSLFYSRKSRIQSPYCDIQCPPPLLVTPYSGLVITKRAPYVNAGN